MTELGADLLEAANGKRIVVELAPYRERRRTRRFAAGLLIGYLAGAWLLPAAAELVGDFLELDAEQVATRVADYAPPPFAGDE